MRRIIVACLLIIVILGITSLVLTWVSTPLAADYTTTLAKVHIASQSNVILAGQCAKLTWNAQLISPATGQFFLDKTAIGPTGTLEYCGLPKEGFANLGIYLVPSNGTPAENYTVAPFVLPQDLRLWSVIGLAIGAVLLAIYLLLPLRFVRFVGTLKFFTVLDNFADRRKNWARVALVVLCGVAAYYYINGIDWSLSEVAHIGAGFIVLWAGGVFMCYILLQEQIEDKTIRFSFSAIASYTLTTLFFFLAAISKLEWLYYAVQLVFWVIAFFIAIRHRIWRYFTPQNFLRIDWVLILLILLSMIVTLSHKETYATSPNGNVVYRVTRDQVYNAGLSYELSRHIPPQQLTSYAGMPERAYHLFPHLTTMLMARFTDQPDMLTAQVQYGYTVFEALICLGMFSIVRLLTKSKWAGYFGVVFVYILSVPWFALFPGALPYLYFTLFPFGINGIDAVSLTSPEMYASIPVVYGVMVGILLIGLRNRHNLSVSFLVGITALMGAALLRFRLQFALAVFPVTLLWFIYWAIQKRRWVYVVGAAILIAFTGLLYLEMQSSVYLPSTAQLLINNNGLMDNGPTFLQSFPFAQQLHDWVFSLPDSTTIFLNGTRNQWLWQIAGMTAFVVLNIIGIPSLLAFLSVFVNQIRKRDFLFFCLFVLFLILASIAGGASLGTAYDTYSVGGQMLLNPNWYVLPLMPVGIWALYVFIRRDLRLARVIWIGLAGILLVVYLYARQTVPQSTLQQATQVSAILDSDEWDTLHYIRDNTPQDAVIFSKEWYLSSYYLVSGTAGRISYVENVNGTLVGYVRAVDPNGDRQLYINKIVGAKTDDEFCQLLWNTPITYLVEYQAAPYAVHPTKCLEWVWASSPNRELFLWHIIKAPASNISDSSCAGPSCGYGRHKLIENQ